MSEIADKIEETEELRKGLGFFGQVAKVGFWGALFAGVLAIGARIFMGSETGQDMMEDSYEAQLIANKLGGFLGFLGLGEIYSEAQLEQTFLNDKTLTTLVSTQLADTNIVIGEKTLATLLDNSGNNRAITLALLKSEGFSVENPTGLGMESLQKALIKAIKGGPILDASGKPITINGEAVSYDKDLDAYSGAVLTEMINDIKDGKAGAGWLRQTRDWIASLTAEEKVTGNAPLGADAGLVGAFLKTHTSQAIELLGLVSEDETVKNFVGNATNQKALTDLIGTLPQEDVTALSKLLFDNMSAPASAEDKSSALATILTSTEFKALKDKNPEAFAEFTGKVDPASLTGEAKMAMIKQGLQSIELPKLEMPSQDTLSSIPLIGGFFGAEKPATSAAVGVGN